MLLLGDGQDLVAKEARIHHSCKRDYLGDNEKKHNALLRNQCFHAVVMNYIQYSIIDMDQPEYASSVLGKLKTIFKNRGGAPEEIESYTVQNLCKRTRSVFDENVLNINSIGKQRTILYKCPTSLQLAATRAFDSHSEVATVTNAAKCLRDDILKQEPRALTEPVTVDSILRG